MDMKIFSQLAEDAREDLTQFLRDIIAIPSMSAQEGDVVERMKIEMERLGYDEVMIDPMGNLIGRIGKGPIKVAFDGHCDTVDVGERANWETDPFDPVVKEGCIFGRGTADQKGGLASAIYGAALLKKAGLPENLSVYVVASVQEEDCDGQCWQYIGNEVGLKPDLVVLTEPTSLHVYRGHRGRMEIEVSTSGVSCHGSAPERGVNAVYKMAPIIAAIEQLNEDLQPREPLGKGTVTISQIRSQSPSQCAVADGCTINLDRRLTVGEDEATSVAELQALPSCVAADASIRVLNYEVPSWTGLVYPVRKYYPSWVLADDHPAVLCAVEAHTAVFGEAPEVGCWTFSTNGVATAGLLGLTTIGFGPGHEHWAHAPNERISIDELVRAAAFYPACAVQFAQS